MKSKKINSITKTDPTSSTNHIERKRNNEIIHTNSKNEGEKTNHFHAGPGV